MFTVWGRASSSNVQKVLWALKEAGVEYERHTVGGQFGGTDTPEYRKLNPNQIVPAIQDGTIKLFESNAIIRYIARKYGAGTIRPRGQRAYALADQWLDWSALEFNPAIMPIFFNKVRMAPEQYDAAAVARAEKVCIHKLKVIERGLGRKPWLAGRHFSYADVPMGILFWRYKNMDIKHANTKNLDRWFEQLKERPAYRDVVMVDFGSNQAEWAAHEAAVR
ncbi:MAG: glutathione S-transferase family protein [Rhizobiales bacterium]|nr:glutathione S-transferase family protein [Hyphomicrobiales bacterium]